MPLNVVVLELSLKYELEEVHREIERVVKALGTRWHRKGKHLKYSVSFVIVTGETDKMLMDRLGPKLASINAIEKFFVFFAPRYALCSDGVMDPFSSAILDAWDVVRGRNQPQNMRQPQRPGGGSFRPIKHSDRGTFR
jgi:hypothetical protein